MQVCYFGGYSENYSRNKILRYGLELAGVKIVPCNVPPQVPTLQKYIKLLQTFIRNFPVYKSSDVLLVGESSQPLAPLAWILSRIIRKPLVVDAFLSVFETEVEDRGISWQKSVRAWYLWTLDKLMMRLADGWFTDTLQHHRYLVEEFGASSQRGTVIPVGADDRVFYPRDGKIRRETTAVVHFHGTFIPLQGVSYIVRAAKLLEPSGVRFCLLGDGQTFGEAVALASDLGVRNIVFDQRFGDRFCADSIARADICLGAFGTSQKAQRVVVNKVYQYLAMRKPVITGDSPAIRELFKDRTHLVLCEMGNPDSLAATILELARNKDLCDQVAEGGYEVFCSSYTPRKLGLRLREVLKEAACQS